MQSQQPQYTQHGSNDYIDCASSSFYSGEERAYTGEHHSYHAAHPYQDVSYSPVQQVIYQPPLDRGTLAAVFCYSFGWLSGLLFFLFGGSNRFVRYHALQSLLFFGGVNLVDFMLVFGVARYDIPYIKDFIALFLLLLNFVTFIGWLVSMVQAARGQHFKLPVAGEIVTKAMGQAAILK